MMHFNPAQRANMKAALLIAINAKSGQGDDTTTIILSDLLREFILEEMRLPEQAKNKPVAVSFDENESTLETPVLNPD